jgi:hypothetical protein
MEYRHVNLTDVAEGVQPLLLLHDNTNNNDTNNDTIPTLFIALELFDNLGHDKIRYCTTTTTNNNNYNGINSTTMIEQAEIILQQVRWW